jgi:16S rRNA (guanine(527)-N(7))-methyltransferase RsmG
MTDLQRILTPVVEAQGGGPPGWPERLEHYLRLLRARNEQVNLVSRRSIDRLVEGQVLPSLAALLAVPPDRPLKVLDVGTGGGLPGIPLKILRPTIQLDLLEATRKKTDFLAEVVSEMGLEETYVHWGRAESPPAELVARAPFDVAFARAVGNEARIQRAIHSLSPGTPLWVFDDPTSGERTLEHPELGPITALRRVVN